MVSSAKPDAPVLIDFGLSVAVDESGDLTATHEQVGNRFLMLPEHRVPDGARRDPRSDVTACCAMALFCLTGVHPVAFNDEQGRLPHTRPNTQSVLAKIARPVRQALDQFFERTFAMKIDDRWQTAEDTIEELRRIRDIEENLVVASEPDGWDDVLVWISDRAERKTFWVRRRDDQAEVVGTADGLFVSGGSRIWRWEEHEGWTAVAARTNERLAVFTPV